MSQAHVFPWWGGYLLLGPLRKRRVDPAKLLEPYIYEGATVLDAGCAMGFFSLPMAVMVGPAG
ncbi:MAG: methyltransferase type 11, partial [Spirochaetales bacterium]